ncbi:glutamyl-tRNA(Gln) amidotransferase subunit A, chloroplastic/mitochondrial [Lactuca sativa]|uniref:glutamyl-tRNA(Gln) amidotransferase subunit A, chloroplastic/mitochondrial n=1 Tax=Lactuca sativa TaxID=4236 RepID=UPI0022B0756D|nr:glutamyl-tRNA(Gln) amidotransferase subunit A, chloroplastic/mitochondrial [Lactuca sativa]
MEEEAMEGDDRDVMLACIISGTLFSFLGLASFVILWAVNWQPWRIYRTWSLYTVTLFVRDADNFRTKACERGFQLDGFSQQGFMDEAYKLYYVLASFESSSNLSRYDGIRYGNQIVSDELSSLYGGSRANGLGPEVKRRILMGTYALSAGYYDAYYKRAQQVRTVVQKSFKAALDEHDILISPAAPSAAYKIGEKKNDPLAM